MEYRWAGDRAAGARGLQTEVMPHSPLNPVGGLCASPLALPLPCALCRAGHLGLPLPCVEHRHPFHRSPFLLTLVPPGVWQVVLLCLGCSTVLSTATVHAPPPAAKQANATEYVRAREGAMVSFGLCTCISSLVLLAILCSVAGQLASTLDGDRLPHPKAAEAERSWAATYAPYAFVLALCLCCCVCCALALPAYPARITPAERSSHTRGKAGDKHIAACGSSPDGSRRRLSAPASSSDSSEGSAPLLTPYQADSAAVSPHLL